MTAPRSEQGHVSAHTLLSHHDLHAARLAHEVNNVAMALASDLKSLRALWHQWEKNFSTDKEQHAKPREHLAKSVSDLIADMEESVKRISKITGSVKHYGSAVCAEQRPTRLADIVEAAVRQVRSEIDGSVTVQFALDPELPHVLADETSLCQVFSNLFLNAVHAMENSPPPSFLRIEARAKDDGPVVVRVSDTGKGISLADQKHLFKPFFTTRRARGGTGLGLYICRQIVHQHGGHMSVESEPGHGATFIVELPRA